MRLALAYNCVEDQVTFHLHPSLVYRLGSFVFPMFSSTKRRLLFLQNWEQKYFQVYTEAINVLNYNVED